MTIVIVSVAVVFCLVVVAAVVIFICCRRRRRRRRKHPAASPDEGMEMRPGRRGIDNSAVSIRGGITDSKVREPDDDDDENDEERWVFTTQITLVVGV